jgi:uncharacterized protein YuzE
MEGHYDPEADAIYLQFKKSEVVDTDEIAPGFIVDLDSEGKVIGLEILYASLNVDEPAKVSFEVFRTWASQLKPAV